MGDQYSLTLKNESSQPGLTFAVYTVTEQIQDASGTFPIAWQTKRLNRGNNVTFTWTLDYSVMFSSQGAQAGAVWKENGTIPASATKRSHNSLLLDWNGDHLLTSNPGAHPLKDGHIYLDTTAQLPSFTQAEGPSIALAIATGDNGTPTPAIAGNSGPNLAHIFSLHPTYYIQAGQIEQGQMADLATTTGLQEVRYLPGVFDATWTLSEENTWVS